MTTVRRVAVTLVLLFLTWTAVAGENFAAASGPEAAATCTSRATTLCLNNQRFKLEVSWKDFQGGTGVGQAVALTSDTGYFWFFSSNNVELVVKVLDARVLNGRFWVFFGALSNVEYTMTVTDTVSGSMKTYFNPSGQFASVGDTEAFSSSGSVDASNEFVMTQSLPAAPFAFHPLDLPEASSSEESLIAAPASDCAPTDTALCLNGGRFRLDVKWKDFQGGTGVGKAIPLTSDTGYFWFFNSSNVELVVKVLDARTLNNRFWVFYGALSNVEYDLTVTDISNGEVRRYRNPAQKFASTGDTQAFPPDLSPAIRSAKQLAERVSQARNDQERQQVLLEILDALNVGVYKSTGAAVLRGAERAQGDFYLYEFELQMLAKSLGRGDTWGIADVTMFLNDSGIIPEPDKLETDNMTEILHDAARSAMQDPDDPVSLATLLTRELGLLQPTPYDTAAALNAQTARFDALQYFLIRADLTLPIVREAGPVAVSSRLVAQSNGYLKQGRISPQIDCEDIADVLKEEWAGGKAFRALLKFVAVPAKVASIAIDSIHGPIVALGVEVKSLSAVERTHYGHDSAGKQLEFRIFVNMRDELPESLINCGWLAGVEFPRKGPIPGVTVVWLQDLRKHGELTCGGIGALCTTSTGNDGIARLIFKPKQEPQVGVGLQIEDTGLVEGVALYQSKLRNTLGSIAQVLTPKSGTTRWFVEYHEAGFELSFDSFIDGTSAGFWATSRALSTVQLKFETGGYTGTGVLSYITEPKSGCDKMKYTGASTLEFRVINGRINAPSTPGGAPDIELTTAPSTIPAELDTCVLDVCQGGSAACPTGLASSFWSAMYIFSHGSPLVVRDWTYVGTTDVYAEKKLTGNCLGQCNETTKLVLRRKQ